MLKSLAFLLVLLAAQHGAVVHDFSHIAYGGGAGIKVDGGAADNACALCPAYAQASAPAFGQSWQSPLLGRAAAERSSSLPHALIGAAALGPRSRGPPL